MMHENESHARIDIHITNHDLRVEGAPEKKVTTFAITMSALDLASIVLGMLKLYLVVRKTNMGVMIKSISVLTLVLEGIRIQCRSRGLELNHMYNMKQSSFSSIMSWIFYCLHLISVLTSGVLSTVQLLSLDFGKTDALLVLFYFVAILEAMIFLTAMAIWIWKVSHGRLFEIVQDECGLGNLNLDMDPTRKFFYDAYYKCVTGNIFDVPKMDFITIAKELLDSTSNEEQFTGARILEKLSTHEGLSEATLHKILTSKDSKVIKRLIKILILKKTFKEDVRRSAAKIVSKLVEKEPNVKQHYANMEKAIELANDLLKNVEGDQCSEDVEKDSSTRAL